MTWDIFKQLLFALIPAVMLAIFSFAWGRERERRLLLKAISEERETVESSALDVGSEQARHMESVYESSQARYDAHWPASVDGLIGVYQAGRLEQLKRLARRLAGLTAEDRS